MSSPRTAPRWTAAVVAGLLPLALTACGATLDAQTYQERSQASASNTAVGTLNLRGIQVLPPQGDRSYEAGGEAEAALTVTNNDDEPDTLVEVSTPAAASVEVLADGRPATLRVPPLGSTGGAITLRLVGLTSQLREGEYVTMTFRFARNGTVEVPVPVATSDTTDRPVYTGEPGDEHEPALQAPAGGHHGEEHGEEAEGGVEEDPSGADGLVEPENGAEGADSTDAATG